VIGGGIGTFVDNSTTSSYLGNVRSIALDSGRNCLYVAESMYSRIRRIDLSTSTVYPMTGGGNSYGSSNVDGIGTSASFNSPSGFAMDSNGAYLFVSESGGNRIRRIQLSNTNVITLAGSGNVNMAFADGIGTAATFNNPSGIVIDKTDSNLYIADSNNYRIRKLLLSTNQVTTIAGSSSSVANDGVGTQAGFASLSAIAMHPTGTYLLVSDTNGRLRSINIASGVVMTLTQSGTFTTNPTNYFSGGSSSALVFDPTGNYIYSNQYMYSSGVMQFALGTGSTRYFNTNFNVGTSSYYLSSLQTISIDASGANMYLGDSMNGIIAKLTLNNPCPAGTYCTAGTGNSTTCPLGSYCPAASGIPISCTLPGVYCPAGSSAQLQCTGGNYCPDATNSQLCPAGSYCPSGSQNALTCSVSGSYCPAGSSAQLPCPGGSVCADLTSREICSAGFYCPPGTIGPQLACTQSGTFCLYNSSAPSTCTPGNYCPNVTVQVSCPAGQYCSSTGLTKPTGSCSGGYLCLGGAQNSFGASATNNGTSWVFIFLSFLIFQFQLHLSF
jgi:hypothetical protein